MGFRKQLRCSGVLQSAFFLSPTWAGDSAGGTGLPFAPSPALLASSPVSVPLVPSFPPRATSLPFLLCFTSPE
ncbi:hypothetical protein QBC46DRAFT_391779 [Diplogelasinospora grovesii]|uniref:Uncharacterized protein n=1 Tax=Diplogelasinospora grovesii TaxID=303347 RepID=A0AAN6N251_9PEZI|nr:hypothetical protein QBC46DRAFT_391779 [Diplogelasinospora grovesii]